MIWNENRLPADAAQGVLSWWRKIGREYYRFSLVVDGWWGVGETGTLRVSKRLCGGVSDYYVCKTFTVSAATVSAAKGRAWR